MDQVSHACPCWVYKSRQREGLYLYLAEEGGFSELPPLLQKRFGTPEFVLSLTLSPDSKLAKEDPVTVMENLLSQGFHLQMPPVADPSDRSN